MAVLSTFKKELRVCPVCSAQFKEEFMMTGSMRQVNIKMTDELRTLYKEFNDQPVVPFIYEVLTCPKCYYSVLLNDFDALYIQKKQYTEKETEAIKNLRVMILKGQAERKQLIASLNNVNFENLKNIETGLAGYILAFECYKYFTEKQLADTKKAVCALRAAWLASDLKLVEIENKYYEKAHTYYTFLTGRPDDSEGFKLGPDWGNNFGFEGVRYIKALLDLKFINNIEDINKKFEVLQNVRATFSKIRGFGKASQSKRGPLLNLAEDMFQKMQPLYDAVKESVETGKTNAPQNLKFDYDKASAAGISLEKNDEQQININSDDKPAEVEDVSLEFNDDDFIEDNKLPDIDELVKNAAVEIVKYAQRAGIRRDAIVDIEKILRKYFKS